MFDVPKLGVANLQFKFLRFILGTGKRSSKWSLLSESGCHPISCKVIQNIIKFWFHLSTSQSPILQAALKVNTELEDKGYKTWYFTFKRILKFLNLEYILLLDTNDIYKVHNIINKVKSLIISKYESVWENELMVQRIKDGKLKFYTNFIEKHSLQNYLKNPALPYKFRKAITNFRIGTHRLPVEVGRYNGNLNREERSCPLCENGIGDEWHYLLNCNNPVIKHNRDQVFNQINTFEPGFLHMNGPEKIAFLMKTNNHDCLLKFGFLIDKFDSIFKEIQPHSL